MTSPYLLLRLYHFSSQTFASIADYAYLAGACRMLLIISLFIHVHHAIGFEYNNCVSLRLHVMLRRGLDGIWASTGPSQSANNKFDIDHTVYTLLSCVTLVRLIDRHTILTRFEYYRLKSEHHLLVLRLSKS